MWTKIFGLVVYTLADPSKMVSFVDVLKKLEVFIFTQLH